MLTVTVKDLGNAVTLFCKGRIVHGYETAILCAAVRRHGHDLTLDLSEVDGIDAAGMGALIALQSAGVYLKLKNIARRVRETLHRWRRCPEHSSGGRRCVTILRARV